MQLANGLRLMKWIMRGARTDFCAKKRRQGRNCCSGLIYQELTPCQEDKDQKIQRLGQHLLPRQPFSALLSSPFSSLTSTDHMRQVLCKTTLMLYLIQCLKQPYEVDVIITHAIDEQTEMQRGEGPFVSHIVSKQ